MPNESHATVTIERPATDGLAGFASMILIDEQPAGKLKRGKTTLLAVAAGDHLITVWPDNVMATPTDDADPHEITEDSPATIRLRLEPGERVQLICQSNQPRLHSWVWFAFWCIMVFVAFGLANDYIPAIKRFYEYVAFPMVIALLFVLVLGFSGLVIWVQRAYKANAFNTTVVSLTVRSRRHDSV